MHVIGRLPEGNPKKLGKITQLLPQLSRAGMGMSRFWSAGSFYGDQDRCQTAVKFYLPSLAFWRIWQQRQLAQTLLELHSRFRHRRASGGSMTGLASVRDRFFDEPSLGIMLGEKLGLSVH